ncbi:hypothetical protein QTH47_12910 [Clostridium perfringens]|nr:hypothetical protein [Clostridium perfringens]
MRIKFKDYIVNFENIEEFKKETSVFTKRQLSSFGTTLKVKEKDLDIIKDALNIGRVSEVDENKNEIRKYKIRSLYNTKYGDEYTYHLEFVEEEDLILKSLKLKNIELKPYEYSERYDRNAIIIDCKIKLDKKLYKEFKDIWNSNDEYFNVVRVGIEDRILKMRFGRTIWSEDEEFIKVSMVLVESNYDEYTDREYFNSDANLNFRVACLTNFKEELLNLLIKKSIITSEEKENLNNNLEENIKEGYWEIYKVKNVDKYN